MLQTKYLIVNADDFGQSNGINSGIMEAFENGIVTSTSLMVRWPSAAAAAHFARSHPNLSVGLHVDLGEWAYRQGQWISLYEVIPRDDSAAVTEEVHRQLATFRNLIGRDPSHIDSHQHVHRTEPLRSVLMEIARTISVPLRFYSNLHYCGGFYGQRADGASLSDHIRLKALKILLTELAPGTTELACHPAKIIDFESMYTAERLQELAVLCDPQIRSLLAESRVELSSFNSVPGLTQGK
jgi:chitin disaccharide deacetylase